MKEKDELKAVAPDETPEEIPAEAAPADDADQVTSSDSEVESAVSAAAGDESSDVNEKPAVDQKKKKGPFIQIPVLISLAIVLLAVAGYFIYSSYFLHLPQDIIWKETRDGVIHYYELTDDNLLTDTYASYEETFSYEELTESGKDIIRVYFPDAVKDFEISMTGSRLLKNQTLTFIDEDGSEFIRAEQVESKESILELPAEVHLDPALTGEWECRFSSNEYVKLFFNTDGSLSQEYFYRFYDGRIYRKVFNATYTISNSYVHFTFAEIIEDEKTGLNKVECTNDRAEYEFDDGDLIFVRSRYARVSAAATPDEA